MSTDQNFSFRTTVVKMVGGMVEVKMPVKNPLLQNKNVQKGYILAVKVTKIKNE